MERWPKELKLEDFPAHYRLKKVLTKHGFGFNMVPMMKELEYHTGGGSWMVGTAPATELLVKVCKAYCECYHYNEWEMWEMVLKMLEAMFPQDFDW